VNPYVCLVCRSVYKRRGEKTDDKKICPRCGSSAYRYDTRFRAPKKSDDAQWKKIEFLFKHGFRFQKVYLKQGDMWTRKRYPKTVAEAKDFVERYADQALHTDQAEDGR